MDVYLDVQNRMFDCDHIFNMIVILLSTTLVFSCFVQFSEMTQKICDDPEYHYWGTYQCHCPERWKEFRANALITNNKNRIPPCQGWDAIITYRAELIQQALVAGLLSPIKLIEMLFPPHPMKAVRI